MRYAVLNRVPVTSSCIASVGYAEEAQILEVEFRSGAVYRYFGVLGEAHAALLAASSKGEYLNRHIKRHYPEARQAPRPTTGGEGGNAER